MPPVQVAVASSCDVPEWARELLKLIPIEVGEGRAVPMGKLFYQTEIRFGNKQQHFRVRGSARLIALSTCPP
jgi:hypothetical protein